jgi:hypothetical protein
LASYRPYGFADLALRNGGLVRREGGEDFLKMKPICPAWDQGYRWRHASISRLKTNMRICIPNTLATEQKLTRDGVPSEVQKHLLGLDHDAQPNGSDAVVFVYFHGKLGEWHLAADCFEVLENVKK